MSHWKHTDRWHTAAKRPRARDLRRRRLFLRAMKHADALPEDGHV